VAIILKLLFSDQAHKARIFEIVRNGKSTIEKFFDNELRKKRPHDFIRMMNLILRFAEQGQIRNREKFVHEVEQIYAFKENQVRVYCFFGKGNDLILCNGAIKKQDQARPEDLDKARKLRNECLGLLK